MNDPNYDDHDDFHEDDVSRFPKDLFGEEETDPCVIRNPGCRFTDKVLDYNKYEWEVEVCQYSHDVQNKVMDIIEALKGKENIPNIASMIAMKVLPL